MSDKITVEAMMERLNVWMRIIDSGHLVELNEFHRPTIQSIRKHLTESDIAHWMDRCHELEAKLAEKPRVSREKIKDVMRDNYIPWELGDFILLLTELGMEVED